MLWSEFNLDSIVKEECARNKIKFREPLKFQIPEGLCIGSSRFSEQDDLKLSLKIHDKDFIKWYGDLEKSMNKTPWNSLLSGDVLKVKIDSSTWIFDSERNIQEDVEEFQGYTIKCIIEISGVYFFKDFYGFLMRAYQLMYLKGDECLIDLSE